MSENELVILNQILEAQHKASDPSLTPSQYFEIFVAELILRDFAELNTDEIRAGVVAGAGDGGIDSLYLFVNGVLIEEDTVLPDFKKNLEIDLIVAQTKTENGFGETPVDKLTITSRDLFDVSKDLTQLTTVYNAELLVFAQRFIDTYKALAIKRPSLSVHFIYASKGTDVHPNVQRKATALEQMIVAQFPNTTCKFAFFGSRQLLELAYKTPTERLELPCLELMPAGDTGYICTVRLADYVRFITDDRSQLRLSIFESNVRDYQGATEVNDAIYGTLCECRMGEEFWWLNNGITIVATEASVVGKTVTIDDPQIVNGLQTSREIFNFFAQLALTDRYEDERRLLVRVIGSVSSEIRDRIITATNSQNYIPPSSLRATETVHRDIEEFFKTQGMYYDRRKNFYRNQGKPSESIVSISSLAQSVMAIVLQKPDYARARPSSLLKSDDDYRKIFAPEFSPYLYLFCARITKEVDKYLRGFDLPRKDQNNSRFYIAMVTACLLANSAHPSPADLAEFATSPIPPSMIAEATTIVFKLYEGLGGSDQVAKGPELVRKLSEAMVARFQN